MPTVDVLLTVLIVLIVLTLAVDISGQRLATVTDVDQERELQRLVAIMRFSEGLDATSMAESIQKTTAYRHESFLLAYVVDALRCAGLTDTKDEAAKYPAVAAFLILAMIRLMLRRTVRLLK